MTLFIKDEELSQENGQTICRRFQETHYQRGYCLEDIRIALERAGMEFVTAYDAFTRNKPEAHSERIYVIAREQGKNAGEQGKIAEEIVEEIAEEQGKIAEEQEEIAGGNV